MQILAYLAALTILTIVFAIMLMLSDIYLGNILWVLVPSVIIFAGAFAYYMAKMEKKLSDMYGDKGVDKPE
jgi:hypothetical protein